MQWLIDLMETYGKLHLADEAKSLNDNMKVLKTDREAVKAHHRRYFGGLFQSSKDDDDVIHIGDQVTQKSSAILPILLSLFTGGLGAAAAVALMTYLNKPEPKPEPAPTPPPAVQQPVEIPEFTDTDTKFSLQLVPSE